ncbi:MAG: agmatine deiminase family protein [Candidatus Cloacimonetes bacterium]|nr:agmatine deiminase family protein [Candidatus Cloacimonadota bacterium]
MRKITLLIFILSILAAGLLADNIDYIRKEWLRLHPGELPIWPTEEELTRMDEIGRDFYPTDPPTAPVRQVAEFEPMSGALIRWNNGLAIPYSLVAEMSLDATVVTIVSGTTQQTAAITAYQNNGVNMANCTFLHAITNSQWTRDYGPWFIFDGDNDLGVVNFIYNRPRPDDNDIPIAYATFDTLDLFGMSVIHTGGNYMCDGLGQAASTTLVWTENPGLSHDDVAEYHLDFCGIETYHVVPDPLGEYIEHIDCWGKFLDVDKVIIGQVPVNDPRFSDFENAADYFAEALSSWGNPYEVYRVETPGTHPQTPYTNSLILNDKVLVPQTGHGLDDDALAAYEQAMPGYQVIGVPYGGWANTDALHCRVHEIPDKGMLYVHHMPVHGVEAGVETPIAAYIFAHSGADLIADSLQALYRLTSDPDWTAITLTDDGNNNFSATLPAISAGDTLAYYIHAADISGRNANHPFIGAPDPHLFTVAPDTQAPVITHEPIEDVHIENLPFTVSAQVTDNFAVTSVEMLCWNDGEGTTYVMENAGEDIWTCEFDLALDVGDVVTYLLTAADGTGNETFLPETGVYAFEILATSVDDTTQPNQDMLLGCSPNPVSAAGASVRFFLATSQQVQVDVYNVRGQRVRSLASGHRDSGLHRVHWNARNDSGEPVASGLYFVRMQTATGNRIQKLLLLR